MNPLMLSFGKGKATLSSDKNARQNIEGMAKSEGGKGKKYPNHEFWAILCGDSCRVSRPTKSVLPTSLPPPTERQGSLIHDVVGDLQELRLVAKFGNFIR